MIDLQFNIPGGVVLGMKASKGKPGEVVLSLSKGTKSHMGGKVSSTLNADQLMFLGVQLQAAGASIKEGHEDDNVPPLATPPPA